jgi:hypothetical protein
VQKSAAGRAPHEGFEQRGAQKSKAATDARVGHKPKYRVKELLEAINFNRSMEAELVQWVTDLESWLAKRLAAVGLITPKEPPASVSLGEHLAFDSAKKPPVLLESALSRGKLQDRGMGDTGLEPVTSSLSSWRSNQLS